MIRINEATIEDISGILSTLMSHKEITSMLFYLKWKDHANSLSHKLTRKERLSYAIMEEMNASKSTEPLYQAIKYIMDPIRNRENELHWREAMSNLNFPLSFQGLKIDESGQLKKISKASSTFSEAKKRSSSLITKLNYLDVDERVLEFCTPELLENNFYHAIFEASKSLFHRIRKMTNSKLDGNKLIYECFDEKNPFIIIDSNTISSEIEKNEYRGFKNLLLVIGHLYRNELAHTPKIFNPKNEKSAINALVIISQCHEILDSCSCIRFSPS